MDAIELVLGGKFQEFIQEIRNVIRPELFPLVDQLENIDPHDFVTPETWFPNESAARGFMWSMFLKLAEKDSITGTKNLG